MQGMAHIECQIPDHPRSMINGYVSTSLHKSETFTNPTEETIIREIDRFLQFLIDSKTREEFVEARQKVFPEFFRLVMAYSVVKPKTDDNAGLDKVERYFIDNRSTFFSDKEQCKRILFNIGTLRRSQNLIAKIIPVEPTDREKDRKLADLYSRVTGWVEMHIGCLVLAIGKGHHNFHPDVLQELLDGSDLAAGTYVIARAAIELREGLLPNSPQHKPVTWDEEDDVWANAF